MCCNRINPNLDISPGKYRPRSVSLTPRGYPGVRSPAGTADVPWRDAGQFCPGDGVAVRATDEQRLRAVLDGLRSIADTADPQWRPRLADARAIVGGLGDAGRSAGRHAHAGPVLDLLRRVTVADDAVLRAAKGRRMLGEALARLESAPSTVAELAVLGPQLTWYLGFDRAIFSRIVDGVWISEAVYVVDDPGGPGINRIGGEQPQRLVPGLHETEVVRRNEPMIVTDVQRDTSRVHRRIAEASRSDSYVAVPVMSGTQVVGLLHADCYIQGRDPDATDCVALATYAKGLQLALSRARPPNSSTPSGPSCGPSPTNATTASLASASSRWERAR